MFGPLARREDRSMIQRTGMLRWLLPGVCVVALGCGADESAVTKAEMDAVQASVQMNSEHGLADTTKYLRYEGGWLADGKGGKMRVVRCVLTQGPAAQKFDLLYKMDKSKAGTHAVDQAVNPAGDNWQTAEKIPWQSQKPKDVD
jgi:hypothetical protein